MKIKYKGLEGIAALKRKRKDEIEEAKPRPEWEQRRGIVTRMVADLVLKGNRKSKRMKAKVFIKDPLNWTDNVDKIITARGKII